MPTFPPSLSHLIRSSRQSDAIRSRAFAASALLLSKKLADWSSLRPDSSAILRYTARRYWPTLKTWRLITSVSQKTDGLDMRDAHLDLFHTHHA